MQYKPFAAFGTVLLKCNAVQGEEYALQTTRKLGWRYITKGKIKTTFNAGLVTYSNPGDFIEDSETISNRRIDFLEDCEWFCFSYMGNTSIFVPQRITLLTNESKQFKQGSDVFIAFGSIFVGNNKYTGPYALRVRSQDVEVRAEENSYLLQFR